VVPVKDGAVHLPALLHALGQQDLPLELIAIDSGSCDASVAILRAAPVRLLQIEPASFDHGTTRNLGAREASTDLVLFLSQDAVPRDPAYARLLTQALESDPRLAGAFARQVPRPEADPITRRDLAAWAATSEQARSVFVASGAEIDALAPLERLRLAAFDNVASAVRRSVLLQHPFAAARFGEDVEWSQRMLRLGYGIGYVPAACVVHSHRRSARALFRRNYLCHRALFRCFGVRTIPDRPHLARALAGTLWDDLTTLARGGASPAQWLCAPAQSIGSAYGQYLGARHEAQGRPFPAWATVDGRGRI
jgi:rhamnosyltransferase